MWPLSFINVGPRRIIHLQAFEMVYPKRRDPLLQARWTMEFLCHPFILPRHSRERKIAMKRLRNALFRNMSKKTSISMKPLSSMLNHVVDKSYLRKLEYEMERVDLPDDYIFSKLDIVVTLISLTDVFN